VNGTRRKHTPAASKTALPIGTTRIHRLVARNRRCHPDYAPAMYVIDFMISFSLEAAPLRARNIPERSKRGLGDTLRFARRTGSAGL